MQIKQTSDILNKSTADKHNQTQVVTEQALVSPTGIAGSSNESGNIAESSPETKEEILEWHFHIYFFQNNEAQKEKATLLYKRVLGLVDQGFFKVVPLDRINYGPIGPHPIGSYEVWCPTEHFARAFSFFTLNRQGLTVLVHPLTREEVTDHSVRAVWMGTPAPVDLTKLSKLLPQVPAQYPELGLGYSSPRNRSCDS